MPWSTTSTRSCWRAQRTSCSSASRVASGSSAARGLLLAAGRGRRVRRVDARRGRREAPGSMRWSRVASAIAASVGDCAACAISCAPSRPRRAGPRCSPRTAIDRRTSGRCFELARRRGATARPTRATHVELPAAPDGHARRVRLPPDLGLGPRAGGERGRGRGRQRHDLHDARPADGAGRAHRHGPRAARARAVRPRGRRRSSSSSGCCARSGRADPVTPERAGPYWSSFLLADPGAAFVVETSGNEMAVESVDRSPRDLEPHDDRRRSTPPTGTRGQPVELLVDPRLDASQAVAGRAAGHRRRRSRPTSRRTRAATDGWTVCMHVDGPEHREATTAAMVAELPVDAGPTVHHVVGSPCTHGGRSSASERVGLAAPWWRGGEVEHEAGAAEGCRVDAGGAVVALGDAADERQAEPRATGACRCRGRCSSRRTNRSNTRSRSASGMPGPSSSTSTRTRPSRSCTDSRTVVPAWRPALSSRLASARRSCMRLPCTIAGAGASTSIDDRRLGRARAGGPPPAPRRRGRRRRRRAAGRPRRGWRAGAGRR